MRKTLALVVALFAPLASRSDQVDMQNGDRFTGHVISVSADSVVLQNDNLGKITLPRAKVSALSVGNAPIVAPSAIVATNAIAQNPKSIVLSATNADIAGALRHLGANTNFIEQIRGQFLADAGPEANQKFNEMLGGVMSGNIDMAGLRAQAKSTADQLRAYQKELGPDAGEAFNSYLAILDSFLRNSAPAAK